MDTGLQVRIGSKIAEGGFSYVFEAIVINNDANNDQQESKASASASSTSTSFRFHKNKNKNTPTKQYALKQIRCPEPSMLYNCRQEAAVHRAAGHHNHPNILPLLGFAILEQKSIVYMLFPKMNRSLRQEINQRLFVNNNTTITTTTTATTIQSSTTTRPPWNEIDVLNMFVGMTRGVQALHQVQYSHRDVKVENIMFEHSQSIRTPILMDFGSAGPLQEPIDQRQQVMTIIDHASSHTTVSYRPPELFDGGLRQCSGDTVDFIKVDVWSLGCSFFATLYGASPSETEFIRSNGQVRIVPCTQLKVLSGIPKVPSNCAAATWYSQDTVQLIETMLIQDRKRRPNLKYVLSELENIIHKLGGRVIELESTSSTMQQQQQQQQLSPQNNTIYDDDNNDDDDNDDLSALLNSHRGFP